jgi:phosphatidylinositol alpha-1,6-mannosyltransferase
VLEALEAFALVAPAAADVDLVIANRTSLRSAHVAGEAAVRERFDARVRELRLESRVRVVGLVPEFRAVIAASAALLFPALDLREGKLDLPLVVLEAIALGVPVALYGIAPLDEFDFAPAGTLVAAGDRGGLAAGLGELLTDASAHERAAAAGRTLAASAFDPSSRAALLRGVYERALAAGPPTR